MSKLYQDLKDAILEHKQLEKVSVHYDRISKQLKEESAALDKLEKQLRKEQRDVEKLEKTSVRSLFYKTLGNKEEKLEKERQEYVEVSLRYNDMYKSLNLLNYELDLLGKKLTSKEVVENRVNALMKQREQELMQTDPKVRAQLMQLNKSIDNTHIVLKDIDEAFAAGGAALKVLQAMIVQLKSAKNWGQYDMMGNNKSASYVKHQAINRAHSYASQARNLLMRFKEELQDVYTDVKLDLRIHFEGIDRFTDVFFDNLITDFIVQQKIKKSLDSVMRVADQVENAMRQLQNEKPKQDAVFEKIALQREQLILNSK